MDQIFVTRKEIITLLESWQEGNISAQDVWDWASKRFLLGDTEYDDWEGDNSAADEVLAKLDSLDMNLVLPEDIPIHIEFLQTSLGQFSHGFQKWRKALNSIDFKKRAKSLKGHPIYGPFCK